MAKFKIVFNPFTGEFDFVNTPGLGSRVGVIPAGTRDGSNREFTTPENFTEDSLEVFHNGHRFTQTPSGSTSPQDGGYYVSESGGLGTGYDTVHFLKFPPSPNSELRFNYIVP